MSKTSEDIQSLKSEGLEFRKYQVDIAEKCVNKNSLVVLPTGLGKTIIAVLTARKTLQFFPTDSKIIVLAPTRPLINQHYVTFSNFLPISQEKFVVLTGKVLPEQRSKLYQEKQILFYTPQTLRNDLVNRRYTLNNVALIIYDEAHHASGDYAYTMIADEFVEQSPDGVTLALTASPGASKKRIQELCKNLYIPIENIHIRTRKDTDVKGYLKPMSIYKIGVNLTDLMGKIYTGIIVVLEERLHYLSQLSFLDEKSDASHDKVFRKDLLKLNKELVAMLQGTGDKTGLYSALSINAQALILYHMVELIEQQGLDVLLYYLEKLFSDSKKKNSSKAIRILASESRIRCIYIELKKNQDYTPENLIHPKFQVLLKIIIDELSQNPHSRILVFVKLRDSIKNIVKRLEETEIIKPKRFVGQATKSGEDKGMSQKKQIE
ncbi:MAG: DEAD/DEAH box helicase, partial [Candidatus Hermodarchaeota archaeon]